MSDPKSSYGEPVDEPKDVDDVVGRAHEGLAHAEAARESAVTSETEHTDAAVPADAVEPDVEPRRAGEPQDAEPYVAERRDAEPYVAERRDAEPDVVVVEETVVQPAAAGVPWYERDDVPMDDEPVVTPSEPVYEPSVVAAPTVAQPIFVQAPEAPHPRGNRGAAAAIGLLAALSFAVLYLAAWLGIGLLTREIAVADLATSALEALATWALWVPVVVFFIAFWLLGAIINRGAWGHWVVWGLLVGVAAWVGHLLGQLFQAPFWMLTAREGADLIESQVFAPLAIVAFVLGRELTIWFGAWVAARGRRMTELNDEAQREYERTLEAGPQFSRV